MAFQIRTAADRRRKPEGNYITYNGRDLQVAEIKITDSGNVVVKLFNPETFDSEIVALFSLEELQTKLNQKAGHGQ